MLIIGSSLVGELREKSYRDGYVESQIRLTLPLQIRELRKRREWTQPELAERAGMGQPRISELEKPGERRLTIETLLRLAAAFDVGLQVRFVPFGDLIEWSDSVDFDSFDVSSFENELREAERTAILQLPKKPSQSARSGGTANQAAVVGGENYESDRNRNVSRHSVLRHVGNDSAQQSLFPGSGQGIGTPNEFSKVPAHY